MDLGLLRSGEVDVGILRDCYDRRGLHLERLALEPRVVVMSERHPLAGKEALTARDLRDEPIACFAGMSPEEREHWAGADEDGHQWRRGPEVNSVSELITELRLGRTIGYVHGSAMPDAGLSGILARPVADLSPSRLEIAVAATSPSARAFTECVRSRAAA